MRIILSLILFLFSNNIHAQMFGPMGAFFKNNTPIVPLTFTGASKSENDCTTAGGVVYDSGPTGTLCRFTAANCPVTWSKADNWSTTTSNTINITWPAYSNTYTLPDCKGNTLDPISIPGGSATRTSGSHTWANTPKEQSTNCKYPTGISMTRTAAYCDDPAYTYKFTTNINYTLYCDGAGTQTVANYVRYMWLENGPDQKVAARHSSTMVNFRAEATITEIGCK